MPGSKEGSVPILKMFGVTMEGNSVCAHIHGFMPYFFVPAPSESFSAADCMEFKQALSDAITADSRASKDSITSPVMSVEMVQKCSMYGFHSNKLFKFLQVTLALPKFLAPAKRLLENGITLPHSGTKWFQVFETNIEYEIRFMVDNKVLGCNWIECPPGKYRLRGVAGYAHSSADLGNSGFSVYGKCGPTPISKCQIELDISYEDFISHPAEGEWQKIAPVRILSFDIECAGRKGVFPEAEHDPVIQIANMVVRQVRIQTTAKQCLCLCEFVVLLDESVKLLFSVC